MSAFTRPAKPHRRVVVTGIGAVSPIGLNIQENWEALTNGRSGISKIESFDPSQYSSQIAGQVKNFDPLKVIEKKEQKKMDRFIQFALEATRQAIEDSGIDFPSNELLRARTGAIVGVGIGGLPIIEKQKEVLDQRGPSRLTPFFIPMVITNMAAGHISIKHGLRGPNYSVTSACSSGAHSIGEAAKYVREGVCDVMVAGGCEASVSPLSIAGFAAMKALSTRNDQPELACRPYDNDRDGFVLSEGAGMVILEDYEHASRRGAKIYGELTGYGASSDAYHMTSGSSEGQSLSIKLALQEAQLNPEDINYINAHGTSTPAGDGVETESLKAVFGNHTNKLWVSSTKSMTGHTLGAAGALESVYSLLSLKNNTAPPTINLENPSENCDLDYVPLTARDGKFSHVLNNSFGFGGTNSTLIFSSL